MSEANEYLLKVKGDAVSIEAELALGEDVRILLVGSVVSKQQVDNDDGTYDLIHVVKGSYATDLD